MTPVLPAPAPPPTPAEWVAPGPDTLATALDELERRLVIAESLAEAGARWQNQRQPGDRTCDGTAAVYLNMADASHRAAQRARAQQERVGWLWTAPTLEDVRTDDLVARWYTLDERADEAARSWMVFHAWHDRYGPRCSKVPPLTEQQPRGPLADGVHAVWLLDGALCAPSDRDPGHWAVEAEPLDGAGVYIVSGPVCVAPTADCDCQPKPTSPGHVLSPRPASTR